MVRGWTLGAPWNITTSVACYSDWPMTEGLPAAELALRVTDVFAAEGAVVYSAAPAWDAYWLGKLLTVAGSEVTFRA